jgi:hypothetical protein
MNTPIGGFFELEIAGGRGSFHSDAVALSSGRACLRSILEATHPSRAWVPFYICDAGLQPFEATGVPVEFYAVDEAFDPVLPAALASGDCVMYVNYFGLKNATAASLAASHGGRAIVDDTQAFFARGYPGAWSFNSARKFFGVPDGGYAYGAGLSAAGYPARRAVHYDHLVNRLLGHQDLAYEQYRENEARVTTTIYRMSALSERLLASADYPAVCARRVANFAVLHDTLGGRNCLPSSVISEAAGVPFCYPLLSSAPVPWADLWARGVFAPRLWPELRDRQGGAQFARESALADRLLALPIDHRYGADAMRRVTSVVCEVMGW